MHKKVVLRHDYNYVGTKVPLSTSIGQIEDLLRKHGCSKMGHYSDMEKDGLQRVTLVFEHHGIPYMIEFPLTFVNLRNPRLNLDISGRIIHDRVKQLLIMVDIDILDFKQAMVPFLAIKSSSSPGYVPLEYEVTQVDGPQGFDIRQCLPSGG